MLYTPILPEAASGTLEPRHVTVPLRLMCPHAELIIGRATALDEEAHVVTVEGREHVWALGDCARVPNAATDGASRRTCAASGSRTGTGCRAARRVPD